MRKFIVVIGIISLGWITWLLFPQAEYYPTEHKFVDAHVHTAGLGYGGSGAFINSEMRDGYKFPIYLWAMGVSMEELEEHGDALVIEKLAATLRQSSSVQSAVILAMDGVIDDNGKLDRERTQIYVPNDFVQEQTARHGNLEFGASVNPNRPDAIERLRSVAAGKARLIKWIPNIMQIDPANPKHEPFYREMVRLNIPLLSHTGQERSFAGANDLYGDPRRLTLPLELGVTVIAAHIATTGEIEGQRNYDRILDMFEQYPNLYTEISSLTQVNKLNYLSDALTRAEVIDRMMYGTDWPLQFFPLVSPMFHLNHISLSQARTVAAIDNMWDRDVALKQYMGVPPEVFARSAQILNIPTNTN